MFDDRRMEKDAFEIRIKFNKRVLRWIERLIFLTIIAVLGVMVVYSPFCEYQCEKGLDDITSTPIVASPEPQIEEEPAAEAPNTTLEEPAAEEPAAAEEPELSGTVGLTIDNIQLDANKTKVLSITVKIDNEKKIFTPLLKIYWYDDKNSPVAVKPRNEVSYVGSIPLGALKTWKLDDELKARYLDPEDPDKEFFKIELFDMANKTKALDIKTKTLTT